MLGFEPRTIGVGNDCSTNWASTTIIMSLTFINVQIRQYDGEVKILRDKIFSGTRFEPLTFQPTPSGPANFLSLQ